MAAVVITLCLFILCVFGVADKPLEQLRLKPSIASAFCLMSLVGLLLEDIDFGNGLWANPGGFFVPVMVTILLWADSGKQYRKPIAIIAFAVGCGAYILEMLIYGSWVIEDSWLTAIRAMFCCAFACLLYQAGRHAFVLSVWSFYLCDVIKFYVQALTRSGSNVYMGGNEQMVAIIAMTVVSVLVSTVFNWVKTKQKTKAGMADVAIIEKQT